MPDFVCVLIFFFFLISPPFPLLSPPLQPQPGPSTSLAGAKPRRSPQFLLPAKLPRAPGGGSRLRRIPAVLPRRLHAAASGRPGSSPRGVRGSLPARLCVCAPGRRRRCAASPSRAQPRGAAGGGGGAPPARAAPRGPAAAAAPRGAAAHAGRAAIAAPARLGSALRGGEGAPLLLTLPTTSLWTYSTFSGTGT